MAPNQIVTVIEQCQISPPPDDDAMAELSLPLTLFDVIWLKYHIMLSLLFYEFPYPKTHMVDTIIPSLKASLSVALKHFLPLAGNMVFPLTSGKPRLTYRVGDTVSITFAESFHDFNYLKGYYPRNAVDFYHLLPQLPQVTDKFDSKIVPLLSIQVTIFPDTGISVGFASRHVVADANTMIGFIKTWASINKLGEDHERLLSCNSGKSISFYDRSVIQDLDRVDEMFWDAMKDNLDFGEINESLGINKVRATFVLKKADIQNLKNLLLKNLRNPLHHVSSFTVTSAYVWTCLLKSGDIIGKKVDDDELEYFLAPFDCRARLKPLIPANYFGNCIGICIAKAAHAKLTQKDGFLFAAQLIGESIHKRVHNNIEGIMKDAKLWLPELKAVNWQRSFGVNGSPKYDPCEADYGWGKLEKFEIVSTDIDGGMSLGKCWKSEGGLEVGLSMSKAKMDAFAKLFADGLGEMTKLDMII